MIARPSGWRWICDIISPDTSSLNLPADNPPSRPLLPFGFGDLPEGSDDMRRLRGSDLSGKLRGSAPSSVVQGRPTSAR